ncbi:MAG TPA: quinolinate synthase NadA, partial [Candidatus Syntrophosphaera sp.]|nr:quinolinate synthase NadA [Candidatus Syntrophosphaera sp.]
TLHDLLHDLEHVAAAGAMVQGHQFHRARCRNMLKITLHDLLLALEEEQFEVRVPEEVARRAKHCLDRMLELSV